MNQYFTLRDILFKLIFIYQQVIKSYRQDLINLIKIDGINIMITIYNYTIGSSSSFINFDKA